MFVVRNKKIFFIISALLIIASFVAMWVYGFKLSTDFTGGSILEVNYPNGRPNIEEVKTQIDKENSGQYSLRPSGDNNFVLRTKEISQTEKTNILSAMSVGGGQVNEVRFNSVGPIFGENLRNKSNWAIGVVILCIVLFITFAFRKVSVPVSSWKYGLATIVALAHDVIIPTGIYMFLGKLWGIEIDLLFITALLAILGYSVHDTIVVFDRVRENLRVNQEYGKREDFEETVGKSVNQTFGRSINTSVTIFLTLLALYLVGSESTRDFALTLIVGVVIGTYSSIFVASPLLVVLEKFQKKNK